MKTLPVILDYCGGVRTDALYKALAANNPGYSIQVLDNASPRDRSRYVTQRNARNSFVGGGLCDSLAIAERMGATFLFFFTNDIELIRVPSIKNFETIAVSDESIAIIGASITGDSLQATQYPWMVCKSATDDRIVPHCDPLCCLIRLQFIRSFGGFPRTRGGWGYDWEMATYARYQKKKILISDSALIRHAGERTASDEVFGPDFDKFEEMKLIYNQRYGDYRLLLSWRLSEIVPELQERFSNRTGENYTGHVADYGLEQVLSRLKMELLFDAPHDLGRTCVCQKYTREPFLD